MSPQGLGRPFLWVAAPRDQQGHGWLQREGKGGTLTKQLSSASHLSFSKSTHTETERDTERNRETRTPHLRRRPLVRKRGKAKVKQTQLEHETQVVLKEAAGELVTKES